jgi:putative SOS response-associated peptidase YedK
VAHGPVFLAIWPHRAITPIDKLFEWVGEGGPKKHPYLIHDLDGTPVVCVAIGHLYDSDKGPGKHNGFVIINTYSTHSMVIHYRYQAVLKQNIDWD